MLSKPHRPLASDDVRVSEGRVEGESEADFAKGRNKIRSPFRVTGLRDAEAFEATTESLTENVFPDVLLYKKSQRFRISSAFFPEQWMFGFERYKNSTLPFGNDFKGLKAGIIIIPTFRKIKNMKKYCPGEFGSFLRIGMVLYRIVRALKDNL